VAGASGATGAAGAVVLPPPTPTTVPHDADVLSTTGTDLVKRLAATLWGKEPDASEVMRLAATLPPRATRGDARALALGMLHDRRAHSTEYAFFRWWLNAGAAFDMVKAADWFPELDGALRTALSYELELFGAGIMFDDTIVGTAPDAGTFRALLTSETTYADESLARLYGLPTNVTVAFERVANPGRPGVLALAGYIAPRGGYDRRWPVEMGMHVMQDFLCVSVPPEPASTRPRPTPDPTRSMRRLATESAAEASCQPCHKPLDGVGFAFLGFDALGRAQPTDGPDPIDDRGTLMFVKPERSFRGVAELGRWLAGAPEAQKCHAAKWLAFFTKNDGPAAAIRLDDVDKRSLEQAYGAFAVSGFKLSAVAAAAATSPAALP
jgi:hypothetical protein